MEKKLQVVNVTMHCNEDTCDVDIDTGEGMLQVRAMPRLKAVMQLASMMQNGITAEYKELPPDNEDRFKLDNLKAELAAAENNLRLRRERANKGYAQTMLEHRAQIDALFLEDYVEELRQQVKEMESNERGTTPSSE